MTLNTSGAISLAGTTAGQSIEIENGGNGTTQISLNCTAVRSLAGVPSGAITMPTNFYGKANQFNYTISSNQTNFCMRAGAVSAGWNQSSKLAVTINSGVILSANSTGAFGMYIQGSFPGGASLKNNGTIVGVGGNGGNGADQNGPIPYSGCSGTNAGPALYIRSSITICNASGVIAAGGGGGGGNVLGSYGVCCCYNFGGGGGGGGRSSAVTNSSGGSGGNVCGNRGGNGGTGTYGSAGGGGSNASGVGGSGGSGGNWGASGAPGNGSRYPYSVGSGGAGGAATCGTGYVTWTSTGTRYGAIN